MFAGYRFRSDVRSHQWVGERLGVPVLPLELVDPRFYHLDTCFCPLADDLAIYYPGAFDEYGRSVLKDRIPRLVEVSPEEAISFSCNAVVVGRTVVLNEGAPKLSAALSDLGFAVRPLDFSEFIKSGGSAKCLTLRIDGEEAAGWKTAETWNHVDVQEAAQGLTVDAKLEQCVIVDRRTGSSWHKFEGKSDREDHGLDCRRRGLAGCIDRDRGRFRDTGGDHRISPAGWRK